MDILLTALMTIITGLTTWILRTVLKHQDDNTEFRMTLWGKDGKNGHASAIRNLRRAVEQFERSYRDLFHRVRGIEKHLRIGEPESGEHEKYRDRDDPEDDR